MPMWRQDDLVRAYVDHEEQLAVSFSAVDEKQARPKADSMGSSHRMVRLRSRPCSGFHSSRCGTGVSIPDLCPR